MAESLFLTARFAAEYLDCTRAELITWADRGWIAPDRRLPGDVGQASGARLWLRSTLDKGKPFIAEWRERDLAVTTVVAAELAARDTAAKARRGGMRKGRAITASRVREQLGCTLSELNRWADDGRLPPDGEVVLHGSLPKTVAARAWLPATVETAKAKLEDWRAQDQAKKIFKRRGLRSVA